MEKINSLIRIRALLDDMEKYNTNFNRALYENMDIDKVKGIFKDFYAAHLPVDIQAWCRVNEPSDDMLYKDGYWGQIIFIRDRINILFYPNYDASNAHPVMVVNTHRSKSIILPVYEINLIHYGVKLILRYNFHNWKVSVKSDKPIEVDFMSLFNESEKISYSEGFSEEQLYPCFKENNRQFTVEIRGQYELFTFMYVLNNFLSKQH